MTPRPPSPRTRLTTVGRALSVTATAVLAAGALGSSAAHAAPADRASASPQVRVTQVYAASTAVETGTTVRTSTVVSSASRTTQPPRTLRLYLTDGTRSYGLTTVATPTLPRGSERVLRTSGPAPLSVPAGRYAVRACFGPLGSQVCRVSRPTVVIGVARLTASPDALDFGDSPVGGPVVTREVTLTNTGHTPTGPLDGRGIGQEGTGTFEISEDACDFSLDPGQSCTVTATYTPGAEAGTASGELQVVSDSTRVSVDLTARTVAPSSASRIDPASYDYGNVPVGGSATKTFRFVNETDTDSTLTGGGLGDSASGFNFDYVEGENSCLEYVVPAHGSCTFSVGFSPSQEGSVSTTVTFAGTGLDPATAVLTGTGTDTGIGTGTGAVRPAPSTAPRSSRDYLAGVR